MFLAELSQQEKKAFLEVANRLMAVDNERSDEELKLFADFRKEMGLDEKQYKLGGISYESAIGCLSNLDCTRKKKIFFELIVLAMSDDKYCAREKEFMAGLQGILGIRDNQAAKLVKCVEEINLTYKRLQEIINE